MSFIDHGFSEERVLKADCVECEWLYCLGCFFLLGFLITLALLFWFFGEWLEALPARRRLQREYRRAMLRKEKGVEEEDEKESDDDAKENKDAMKKKRKKEEREKDRKMWNRVVQWEVHLKIALTENNIPAIVKTLTEIRDGGSAASEEEEKGGGGERGGKKRRGCCAGKGAFHHPGDGSLSGISR